MRRTKGLGVFLTLALMLGLVVGAAPQALAQDSTDSIESFMPNENATDKDQLSDRNDGVDEMAHLTAVTIEDFDYVSWFFCDPGVIVTNTATTFDELFTGDCELVGEDSEGVTPNAGDDIDDDNVEETAFEAYTGIGDGDTDHDDQTVDVIVVACEGGAPADEDAVEDDCEVNAQQGIYVDNDDEDVTDTAVPSGEFVGVCYPTKLQGYQGTDELDSFDCDEEAEFRTLTHGDVISPDGFYILYRASEDVTSAASANNQDEERITGACYAHNRDHDTGPGTTNVGRGICDAQSTDVAVTNTAETSTYNEYIAHLTGDNLDSTPDDCDTNGDGVCDTEGDLAIYGTSEDGSGGSGLNNTCLENFTTNDVDLASTDVCVFSEIYFQIQEELGAEILATFNDGDSRFPDDIGKDTDGKAELRHAQGEVCDDAQTTAQDEVTNEETVIACLLSQFGREITDTAVTFQVEGVGGIVEDSCEGDSEDTDGDGLAEICSEDLTDFFNEDFSNNHDFSRPTASPTTTGEADVTGTASVDINSEESGSMSITVCADNEAGSGDDNPDAGGAGVGCDADEPSATVTKTYGAGGAALIDLTFVDSQAAGTCSPDNEFRQNTPGQQDTLRVCTRDEFGNPASSDELGADLEWSNTNPNAAQFVGNPPDDTDASGSAEVDIRAVDSATAQNTTIEVCLRRTGQADNCDSIQKTNQGRSGGPGPQPTPECSDGADNDDDGFTDFVQAGGGDPDCTSASDNSESASGQPLPLCNNNVDDDGDGTIDHDGGNGQPRDPGCTGPNDQSESPDPQPPARSNTNTTIRYDESGRAFKGSVGSNRKACSRFRKVVLKKHRPGKNKTVGRDNSNRAGNWKVRKRRANGRFYAVAKRKRFTNRTGRVIICLRDKSPTINV